MESFLDRFNRWAMNAFPAVHGLDLVQLGWTEILFNIITVKFVFFTFVSTFPTRLRKILKSSFSGEPNNDHFNVWLLTVCSIIT
jgi:hypothetical protein